MKGGRHHSFGELITFGVQRAQGTAHLRRLGALFVAMPVLKVKVKVGSACIGATAKPFGSTVTVQQSVMDIVLKMYDSGLRLLRVDYHLQDGCRAGRGSDVARPQGPPELGARGGATVRPLLCRVLRLRQPDRNHAAHSAGCQRAICGDRSRCADAAAQCVDPLALGRNPNRHPG